MYVLDINSIIYYTDDELAAVAVLEPIFEEPVPIYISTLTELELFSYAYLSEEEATLLETFLASVQIMPLTSQIARIAGELRRLYPRLKAFDSGIAATAMFTASALITRNVRDFEQIGGLSILPI